MAAPDTLATDPLDDYALVRGWTPERQTRFLDHLALKGNVHASCRRVGLSREAAYRLRRRDRLFARGWAAAMVKAHDASIEVLADRAIEGVEEPIYHRGELVGTRRRYDTRLLLAHIARLDKLLEDEAAQTDAGRFDELLARMLEYRRYKDAGAELSRRFAENGPYLYRSAPLPLELRRISLEASRQAYDVSLLAGGGGGSGVGGGFALMPELGYRHAFGGGVSGAVSLGYLFMPALQNGSGVIVGLRMDFKSLTVSMPVD